MKNLRESAESVDETFALLAHSCRFLAFATAEII